MVNIKKMQSNRRVAKPRRVEPEPRFAVPPATPLAQPQRDEKTTIQFTVPADLPPAFKIASLNAGYNSNQTSKFFMDIWQFWLEHKQLQ